jgi:cytochrome c oxidase subunit I
VDHNRRLALYHYWVAFAVFLPAVLLGVWQMLMRSPLPVPFDDSVAYYASVTLHGTAMAYVVTTFFIMGFGYAVAVTSLGRPMLGAAAAWIGFAICLLGTAMAVAAILSGQASVLYTFYPPLLASGWYYGGAFLLIAGSMIWVILMVVNMAAWKRDNPGRPVPLAMFAITATAFLWAWAAAGVLLELGGILLPRAFGWSDLIDAALGRTLFSVTLHAIVYFWLMPAYIAFYTLVPQAAGGRLYSDTMGRLTFIMFLVFSLPVGMHHLFGDPEHGSGFKFLQSFLTFLVALPTLLTVFSICASLEIAGRLRGGRGLLGWIPALPWNEPMILAVGLSLVMLGLGGFGGLINMSYAMNSMIHNTSWVTAHFHLIFGGAGEGFPESGRSLRQSDPTLRLVFAGDPKRGVPPCAACHGPGAHKLGAPALQGQHAAYIERQLAAFAQGIRQNDINEQMRTIAAQLTPDEMHAVSVYYGAQGAVATTQK